MIQTLLNTLMREVQPHIGLEREKSWVTTALDEYRLRPDELDQPLVLHFARQELTPLDSTDKAELKEQDWPDEIIEKIGSQEELAIYRDADVSPDMVNDKAALTKNHIDLDRTDDFGRTNLQRMEQGLAPLDEQGRPLELHHLGQGKDAPLVELTPTEHRGQGNDTILHDKSKESEIDRKAFQKERAEHWQARAEQLKAAQGA